MSLLVNQNRWANPFKSIVSDFFDNDRFLEGEFFQNVSTPAINVKETEDNFQLELAAPGMEKNDFHVDVENGVLKISAEKSEEKKDEKENYTRKEFNYSSFHRAFTLPESVNTEDIKASYKNGLLNLTLAKKEESKKEATKSIAID